MDRFSVSLLCFMLAALPGGRAQEVTGTALPDGAIARVGSIQLRHQSALQQLMFLPNGFLAALDMRGCLRIWDTTTGHERRNFVLKAQPVESNQYEMMRRMEWMMMRGRGGKRGFRGRDYEPNALIASQVFSADGRFLAVTDFDKLTIHDTTTGKVSRTLVLQVAEEGKEGKGMREFIRREMLPSPVAFSADNKYVVAGSSMVTGTLKVFDVASGKDVHTLRLPREHPVYRLMFSPTATHLIGQADDQLIVWDLKTGKRVRTYQGDTISALAISPDGRRLATAHDEGPIRLWDDTSEEESATIAADPRQGRQVLSMAFAPDGRTLATGCSDNALYLYDPATGKEIKKLEGQQSPVGTVAFSLDGKLLASGDITGRIRLWDIAKGKESIAIDATAPVHFVAVEGQKLVLGGSDGSVRHADMLTGAVVKRFKGPETTPGSVARFSQDGKMVALFGNEKGGSPVLWDVAQGKELPSIKGVDGYAGIVFSPDGKRVALSHGDEHVLQLWDLKSNEMLATMGPRAWGIAFSPDGRTLLSMQQDRQYSVWEIATGKVRLRFPGPSQSTRTLSISPDGRQLATASSEIIRLWSLTTGKVQRALAAHTSTVTALAYSQDGARLASASEDGSVHVWDLAKGQALQHFSGHRDTVNSLAFSADGKILISGSSDGTALVWDLEAPIADPAKREAVKKLEALWEALASEEPEAAFAAQNSLVTQADAAVAFLQKGLSPAASAAPEQVRKWIADLDDRRFTVREKAMQELTRLGGQAAPALKQALEGKPSSEAAKRLRQLIDALTKPAAGGEVVRQVRAVEVLEQINSAPARQLLAILAKGAAGARLTEEAKAALERVASRSPTQGPR